MDKEETLTYTVYKWFFKRVNNIYILRCVCECERSVLCACDNTYASHTQTHVLFYTATRTHTKIYIIKQPIYVNNNHCMYIQRKNTQSNVIHKHLYMLTK